MEELHVSLRERMEQCDAFWCESRSAMFNYPFLSPKSEFSCSDLTISVLIVVMIIFISAAPPFLLSAFAKKPINVKRQTWSHFDRLAHVSTENCSPLPPGSACLLLLPYPRRLTYLLTWLFELRLIRANSAAQISAGRPSVPSLFAAALSVSPLLLAYVYRPNSDAFFLNPFHNSLFSWYLCIDVFDSNSSFSAGSHLESLHVDIPLPFGYLQLAQNVGSSLLGGFSARDASDGDEPRFSWVSRRDSQPDTDCEPRGNPSVHRWRSLRRVESRTAQAFWSIRYTFPFIGLFCVNSLSWC